MSIHRFSDDSAGGPGPLAQAPILTSAASAPNILIVVDDSGSMGWRRSGQPKRPMQQAQDAAISLLDSLSNVRVGVASFSRYNFGGELDQPVVDLDTNRALIWAIRDLTPRRHTAGRHTAAHGSLPGGPRRHGQPRQQFIIELHRQWSVSQDLILHPDDAPQAYPLSEVCQAGLTKVGADQRHRRRYAIGVRKTF